MADDDDIDQDALAAEWGAEDDDASDGQDVSSDDTGNLDDDVAARTKKKKLPPNAVVPNAFSIRKKLTACSASSLIKIAMAISAVSGPSLNPALSRMNVCRCLKSSLTGWCG